MDTLIKQPETQQWSLETIKQHINSDFGNVEKAMVRLYENRLAVNEQIGYELKGHNRSCYYWIEMFAFYIQGRNEKGDIVYKPKSLLNPHSKIFHAQKLIPEGYTVETLAREITLAHSDYILFLTMKNLTPQLQIQYNYPMFNLGVLIQPTRRDKSWCFAVRKDLDIGHEFVQDFESAKKITLTKQQFDIACNKKHHAKTATLLKELGHEQFNEIYNVYRRYNYTTD